MSFILFALMILIVGFLYLISSKKRLSISADANYVSKKPLSIVEQSAYWKLKEAVGDERIILAQVAFSSFIRTTGDKKAAYSRFNQARQKVADFVICSKDFSILAIVEIDDKTHKADKDVARDKITAEAGIKTLRFQPGNLPSFEELNSLIT